MIKIMIVDDMPVFQEYLREAVDWQTYGFEICAVAENGKEALELVQKYDPDIVLSDINMPYMDGLSLAEKLKTESPNTSVVLITGHSEFEYAQRAVKLGVADYILKPFEKETLIVTLLGLQDNIIKAIEEQEAHRNLEARQRENLYRELIHSSAKHMLASRSKEVQHGLNQTLNYRVTAIEIETEKSGAVTSQTETSMNWKQAVGTIYMDLIDVDGVHDFFTDYEGRIIAFTGSPKGVESPVDTEALEDLMKLVKERLSLNISIGIGTPVQGIEGLRTSYLEAVSALGSRFDNGLDKIYKYEAVSAEIRSFGFYSAEINEQILSALTHNQKERALTLLRRIFHEAERNKYSSAYKHIIYMGLMSLLLSYIVQAGRDVNGILSDDFRPYESLSKERADSVKEAFLLSAYDRVIEHMVERQETKAMEIAQKAKAYIDQHFASGTLSTEDISRELLVNQTYLRKMFKSEAGMTLTEYITKVRMEEAKTLIQQSEYKLSSISEAVGYSDSGYFSKCFKKYYGSSPSSFR